MKSFANEVAGDLSGCTVAVDGKTLRGSHDRSNGKSALHSVTAWVSSMKLCIGMKSVEDKSNEIPAVQKLIDMLDLKGAVVTADAMHCQKQTAEKIQLKEADYILYAKDNQPSLKEEIDKCLLAAMEQEDDKLRRRRTREVNRGREEFREVVVLPVPKQNTVFKSGKALEVLA